MKSVNQSIQRANYVHNSIKRAIRCSNLRFHSQDFRAHFQRTLRNLITEYRAIQLSTFRTRAAYVLHRIGGSRLQDKPPDDASPRAAAAGTGVPLEALEEETGEGHGDSARGTR